MAGRVRVAVVFGGRSSEHAISCVSAGSVLRHLDRERFDVVPVGIARDGAWVLGTDDPEQLAIHGRALPSVDPSATAVVLPGDPTRGGLVVLEPGRAGEVLGGVDVVFPVLHGPFGEDGTIQGLLEMAGVPYVGAGVLASAAGMDKEFTKKLLAADGLPVGDLVVLRPGHPDADRRATRPARPAGVRQARPGRLVGGHHPGHGLGRRSTTRSPPPARTTRRCWSRRRSSAARWSAACWSSPTGRCARACPPRSGSSGRRPSTTSTRSTSTTSCEFDIPAKLDDDVVERVQERGRRGVPGAGLPGARARRLLRRRRTASRWSTR